MQSNIVGRALAVLPGKEGGKESGSTWDGLQLILPVAEPLHSLLVLLISALFSLLILLFFNVQINSAGIYTRVHFSAEL